MQFITEKSLVLFQGDSITDAGRSREDDAEMGRGYAGLIAAWFTAMHPEMQVRFVNRGVGGNRVVDLQARWQVDCLDLKPDVVSIMIGINDTWRRYDSNKPTSVVDYENGYKDILAQSQAQGSKIVMIEPFVLPVPADRATWREDLDPKIDAARRLAREFGALYIPLDGIFAQAAAVREPAFWGADGVHPTPAGHALIAQSWLKAVGAL